MACAQRRASASVIGGRGATWYGTGKSPACRSCRLIQSTARRQKPQGPSPNTERMAADLEGVVATSTRLSHVDGEAGRLTIAGYAVEDLAPYARFEEVAFLLLYARLPDPSELARFTQDLAGRRALPRAGFDVLRAAAAAQAPPMDVLRMAAALLSLGRQENPLDDAMTAIACFPTIVGA